MAKNVKSSPQIVVTIDESDKLAKQLAQAIADSKVADSDAAREKVGRRLATIVRQRANLLSERALKEAS